MCKVLGGWRHWVWVEIISLNNQKLNINYLGFITLFKFFLCYLNDELFVQTLVRSYLLVVFMYLFLFFIDKISLIWALMNITHTTQFEEYSTK